MTGHFLLVGLRLGVVAAGALMVLWTLQMVLRAQDHRGTYLLLLAGFGLLTLGVLLEGILFEFAGWDLAAAHTAEAFVSAGGFALILLSILRSEV